jgi:hypothetical protein
MLNGEVAPQTDGVKCLTKLCKTLYTVPGLATSVSGRITARLWGRTARHLPMAPTYKGCYNITGIIRTAALVNAGFRMWKICSENYPQFRHVLAWGTHMSRVSPGLNGEKCVKFLLHHIMWVSSISHWQVALQNLRLHVHLSYSD